MRVRRTLNIVAAAAARMDMRAYRGSGQVLTFYPV